MKTILVPRRAEFINHQPRNLILLENDEAGVVIRAARDNFSNARKLAFIREAAAEGFIADDFALIADCAVEHIPGLTWLIDGSWAETHLAAKRRGARFIIPALLAAVVLLLGMLSLTFVFAR